MATRKPNRCSWLIPTVLLILLTLDHRALAKPNSPPRTTTSIPDEAGVKQQESSESCGINMECVPRTLCQDNVISDGGFSLISPIIGHNSCSKTLYRCCKIKQKEDDDELKLPNSHLAM